MIIAVIGNSSCSIEEAKLAETVGELLAEQGATVICGGLGGVMEAACRGAKAKGGLTIGILPGQDSSMANPWVDIPVVTGLGEARNVVVVKSAKAIIAISGGYGTLNEIAYALKSGISVIGLNTWSLSRKGEENDPIIRVQSAAEAVDKAISLAKKHKVPKSDSSFSPSPSSSPIKGEEGDCLLMANCHSEQSEESIGDSSPIGLRMTRWGVAKQSQETGLVLGKRHRNQEIATPRLHRGSQ